MPGEREEAHQANRSWIRRVGGFLFDYSRLHQTTHVGRRVMIGEVPLSASHGMRESRGGSPRWFEDTREEDREAPDHLTGSASLRS